MQSKVRIGGSRVVGIKPVTHSRTQGDLTICVCGHPAQVHVANSPVIKEAEWPCLNYPEKCPCKNWTQDRKEYNAPKCPEPVAAPKHGTQVRYAVCKQCGSRILWNNLDRNWYHSATNEKRCGNDK